ncbi:MAG: methyltransferase domain-containing protein [Actinomycetales bacterium]|nr:methyltransferase domain-containing protein [Actinomycetales bacterium]
MISDKVASWAYAEAFVPEDETILRAADRADQLGAGRVSAGTGALLAALAAATRATAVVEIGTGAGDAGLWLLRGMAPDGVLTTIDTEAEHQRAAREAFAEAGIRPTRVRTITGRPLEVLPRLADGAYDLVVADGDPLDLAEHVEQALRVLRPGGVLVVVHALGDDRVPDPARRDEVTTALREVARRLRDDERVVPALVPTGDGVLLAVRR